MNQGTGRELSKNVRPYSNDEVALFNESCPCLRTFSDGFLESFALLGVGPSNIRAPVFVEVPAKDREVMRSG